MSPVRGPDVNSGAVSWDGRPEKRNMKSVRCVSWVCEDLASRQPSPGTRQGKPWAGEVVVVEKVEPGAHSQD